MRSSRPDAASRIRSMASDATEITASFTQLRVQLGSNGLVPQLHLAQCFHTPPASVLPAHAPAAPVNSGCVSLSTLFTPRYCRWLRSTVLRSFSYPARSGGFGACSEN
jgi:hypothetical protein